MSTLNRRESPLLFWNRLWLVVFVLLGLAWDVRKALDRVSSDISTVKTSWNGDTLEFSSIRGFVIVTHLMGYSERRPVGAALPTPAFLLDSGGARVEPATWRKLIWRDDAGRQCAAPPTGSPITGLYQRLEATEWQGAKKEP